MLPWHQYLVGFILIFAGFMHLQKPNLYERILPKYIPSHKTIVLVSGLLEMIFGAMLLIADYQHIGAWAWMVLLVLFLPVHIYMLQHKEAALGLPKWLLLLRIPLQFILMYWIYQYA